MIDYIYSISDFLFIILGWLVGGAAHLIATLYEEYKLTGEKLTIMSYRKKYPYKVETGFLTALVALIMAWDFLPMTPAIAGLVAYNADSIGKKIVNSMSKKYGLK